MEGAMAKSNRPKSRQSIAHIPSKSSLDRDNATADIATIQRDQSRSNRSSKKKLRGKSLGPGGLEALQESSGNTIKLPSSVQIKSILKPTVPLTPPKVIPSFDELRKRNTGKSKSPLKQTEDLLIDFSTPGPNIGNNELRNVETPGITDPFSPVRKREQSPKQNEAQEPEAERQRQAEKQAILDRRAARRKSMANRRVSFAPEATLHTWSVMELAEDSTTSSSANSTRRQSSITAQQTPDKNEPTSDPPSTPPKQADDSVAQSPAHQRDLHQKKRRRSSTGLDNTPVDDIYSSSPSGDITGDSSPVMVEDSAESDDDTDGDEEGETAMSLDDGTMHSESSTQSSLDERLRQAANQAGTKGIEYDENGDDLPMELATTTVTHAFQPWIQSQDQTDMPDENSIQSNQDETEEMSMDVTKAVGGIISTDKSPVKNRRKSVASKRRSSVARRRSSGENSSFGDETMDFTTVGGAILTKQTEDLEDQLEVADEEMTMEFTNVIGGVLNKSNRRASDQLMDDDTMDMTAAVGGILPPIEENTEPQTNQENDQNNLISVSPAVNSRHLQNPSMATTPKSSPIRHQQHIGAIASETGSPSLALKPRLSGRTKSNIQSTSPKASPKRVTPAKSPVNPDRGTPMKQVTPLPSRSEKPNRTPISAKITRNGASPKRLFKEEIKARTSPGSVRKENKSNELFSHDELTGRHIPNVVLQAPNQSDRTRRRSSGIGIDQIGFGSPRVSELLSRRSSIGENAPEFKLVGNSRGVIRFEDPRQIENEIDAERAEEQRRESGRLVMEQEADEQQQDTLKLKEMIESMSPAKPKSSRLKGRKSLAVGAARGVLGKRPAELDIEEDDENELTPKRLKVVERQDSPVKQIRLPKPPSKDETTGRLGKDEQTSLQDLKSKALTPTVAELPSKSATVGSPQATSRFKDVDIDDVEAKPTSFEVRLDNVVGAVDISTTQLDDPGRKEDDKISLQAFLNMTNIHFIELSTTKRRHTMAQSLPSRPSQEGFDSTSTESCFITAATTLPLLELYQHATRELKSYISSGRKIIRSIETETLEDQPPLFREYVDARPDVKLIMDNQFRNGKTNARLLSKEGWYAWRSQLVEGLQNGLEGIKTGMLQDSDILDTQQQMLDSIVPELTNFSVQLETEADSLQQSIIELDSVDHETLNQSRAQLQQADEVHRQKLALLKTLQEQMNDREEALSAAAELKAEIQEQILEAERVRELYRGWPVDDVKKHLSIVDEIEMLTGWRLMTAEDNEDESDLGVALTLGYKEELRLFFYPSVFQVQSSSSGRRRSTRKSRSISGPTAPISLTYAPTTDEEDLGTTNLSTEKRFFLQLVKSQLQAFAIAPKGSITSKVLLDTIDRGWTLAKKVSSEIRLLNQVGVTNVSIVGDETLKVKTMLLLQGKGRVDIEFLIMIQTLSDGNMFASTSVAAQAEYGSITSILADSKLKKVKQALSKEIESKELGSGAWINAIHGFQDWVRAQELSKPVPKSTSKPQVQQEVQDSIQSSTPIKRSPLAQKKPNVLQKKALPVPKQRLDKGLTIQPPKGKENVASFDDEKRYGYGKPAMDPEMQEAMMHTPIKRIGALRRSPI